jgi:hypothetical protein
MKIREKVKDKTGMESPRIMRIEFGRRGGFETRPCNPATFIRRASVKSYVLTFPFALLTGRTPDNIRAGDGRAANFQPVNLTE